MPRKTFLACVLLATSVQGEVPREQLVSEGNALYSSLLQALYASSRSTYDCHSLNALEKQTLLFRRNLESNPSLLTQESIEFYLNRLLDLATLRVQCHQACTSNWTRQHALEIPSPLFLALGSWPLAVLKQPWGQQSYSYIVEENRSRNNYQIRLSAGRIQALELAQLALHPDSESYLELVRYLGLLQLESNFEHLQNYFPHSRRKMQETGKPEEVFHHLPSSLDLSTLENERELRKQEVLIRPALAMSAGALLDLPELLLEEADTLSIIESVNHSYVQSSEIYKEYLKIRPTLWLPLLQKRVLNLSQILGASSQASQLQNLKRLLAESEVEVFVQALKHFQGQKRWLPQDLSEVQNVNSQLESLEERIFQRLPLKIVQSWLTESLLRTNTELPLQRRKLLTESLLAATDLLQEKDAATLETTPLLAVLLKALEGDVEKLQLTSETRQAFAEILNAGDYLASLEYYTRWIASLTEASVVSDGVVSSARVKEYLQNHGLLQNPEKLFPRSPEPLRTHLLSSMEFRRKKTLRDALTLGEWLGFHRSYTQQLPTLQTVLPTPKARGRYRKAKELLLKNEYPLLMTELRGRPLYQHLASLKNPDRIKKADRYVLEALLMSMEHIQEQARQLSQSRDKKDLEPILTSSALIGSILESYPEFQLTQDEALTNLLHEDWLKKGSDRYIAPVLSIGFGSLLLLHGTQWLIKPASPFVKIFLKESSPFWNTFMKAALGLLVVDTTAQAAELQKAVHRATASHQWATGGVSESNTLVSWEQAENARRVQLFESGLFVFRLTLDTVFMYAPFGQQIVHHVSRQLSLAEWMADLKAFSTLRLAPGKWNTLEEAYRQRMNPALSPLEKIEVEQAFRRLHLRRSQRDAVKEVTPSDTPGRAPSSLENGSSCLLKMDDFFLQKSRLRRQILATQIDQQLSHMTDAEDYQACLQHLETFAAQDPSSTYELAHFLQLRWELRHRSELQLVSKRTQSGFKGGTMAGLFALSLTFFHSPQQLPRYFALFRHAFPLIGGLGTAALAAGENHREAERMIFPPPATFLFLDTRSAQLPFGLDESAAQIVSLSSGIAASSWFLEIYRLKQAAAGVQLVTTPLKWNPYILAGSLALGWAVEVGTEQGLKAYQEHELRHQLDLDLERMDAAHELGRDYDLLVAAESWERDVLALCLYWEQNALKNLSSETSSLNDRERMFLSKRDALWNTAPEEPTLVTWLQAAHQLRSGSWGSNPGELLFRAAGVLKSYRRPFLQGHVDLLLDHWYRLQALLSSETPS